MGFYTKNFNNIKYLLKGIIIITIFTFFSEYAAFSQCTVVGSPSSGQRINDFCAPVTKQVWYRFDFSSKPSNSSYRVIYFWGDGSPNQNFFPTVEWESIMPGDTIWYVLTEPIHVFPEDGACDFIVNMVLVDEGYQCGDSRQTQEIASWHTDDIALAHGHINIDPLVKEVCEGDSLINFQFIDASTFACNVDILDLRKPNNQPRHVQFVYNTNPTGGQGIPDLYINVHGTIVYLTDANGDPVPNSWTVNPLDGSTVSPYSTNSGYFEGPVIATGFNPVGGDQLTFPISFPGTTTVEGDYMEVTVRNWNFCNPWNNSQTNPNAGIARTSTARIIIIDSPDPPIVSSPVTYCHNNVPLSVSATPNNPSNVLKWYSDPLKTVFLGTGNSYTHNKSAAGVYRFYVAETSGVNNCEGQASEIVMEIREPLPQPGAISGPSELCLNATGQTFSVTNDPATMPVGGATEYVWTVPAGWTIVSGQGSKEITVNIGGTSGDKNISVRRQYTSAPLCTSDPRQFNITINPLTVGGSVSGGGVVCQGSNSGTLTLSDHVGTVTKWQVSSDEGSLWSDISHTNVSYTSPALTIPGTYWYRAFVKSGLCSEIASNHTVVKVDSASVGGTIEGGTTPICLGSSTGEMTLTGYTGTVNRWQWRRNSGLWNTITTTSTTFTHTPTQAGTYEYRARVRSGVCNSVYSSILKIIVDPTTVGGTVSSNKTICQGSNSGTLTLSGHVGTILRWQVSDDEGSSWTDISNTTSTYTSPALNTPGKYWYRAQVQSGACLVQNSNHAEIVVSPTTVGGTVTGGSTICQGSNSGLLTLSGHTGNILNWQVSTNNGGLWTNISNTNATYTSGSLNTPGTYWYRAQVQSPGCIIENSNHTVVIVDSATVGGTINGSTSPICIGSSTGNLSLTGYTGSILRWEKRVGGAGPWTQIINTTPSYNETPSTSGTWEYRALVKSGSCSETYSSIFSIVVVPATVGGNVSDGDSPVCYGINTGTMNLSGHTGSIVRWEKRLGTEPWSSITNTSTSYSEIPSSAGTWQYRAVVQNGVCPAENSSPQTIIVHPRFEAAQLHDDTSICHNSSADFYVAMTGGTSTYTINYNVNGTPKAAVSGYLSGGNISTGTLTNGTYTYTLTSVTDINGCPAESLGTPITIETGSIPSSASISGSGDKCDGEQSNISFTIIGGAPPYTINYEHNNVPQPTINNYISGTNHSLNVLPVGTHNYKILSVTDNCGASIDAGGLPTDPYVIVIHPIPSAATTINNTPSICYNGTTDIVLNSSVPNTDFIWNVSHSPAVTWVTGKQPSGGTLLNGNGNSIAQILAHTGTSPVTVTYTITPRGPGSTQCTGPSITKDVVVNPLPILTTSLTPPSICSGTVFNYTPASATNGTTFSWSRATVTGITPAGPTSGTDNPGETLTNITTEPITVIYSFTLTANGCSNVQNVSVTVNPTPILTSTLSPSAVCSGTTFSYTPTSATNGTTFSWSRASTPGISPAGSASGTDDPGETLTNTTTDPITVTYSFTLTANGCSNTQNVNVVVNPKPVLSSTLSPSAICSGTSFKYTPVSATVGTAFSWTRNSIPGITPAESTSGTNDIDEILTNTTPDPITVNYIYTLSANGCTNTDTVSVVVNPKPVLSSSLTPSAICSGTTFNYTPLSETAGTSFSWSRASVPGITPAGPTSGTNIPGETLTNNTTDPITVTYVYNLTANGCTNTQNVTVVVNPKPVLSSSLTPSAICSGTTFNYTPLSATAGTSFSWSRASVPGITPAGPTSGVDNPGEALTNNTADPITVNYIYTLSANGCTNTDTVSVVVNPKPVLSSSLTPSAICSGTTFNYTPLSATAGTSFSWSRASVPGISPAGPASGTNNPGETLTNNTNDPITVTYVYNLTANGCTNTQNVTVVVNPKPVLSSSLTPSAICSGTTFNYTPLSETAGTSFSWSRASVPGITPAGPTSGTNNPGETLTNNTADPITVNYIYTLSANGCTNTDTVSVVVNPKPVLSTSLTPSAICSGTTFNYTPLSETAGTSFSWSRASVPGITPAGPTSGVDNPGETLTNTTTAPISVTYVFTLTANGCSNTQNVTVVVNPTPVLTSSLNPASVCSNTLFSYTPSSGTAGTSFTWSRAEIAGIENAAADGNGNVNDTLRNRTSLPIDVTYEYTLTANGCSNIQDVIVTIKPEPVISNQSVSVCSGEELNHKILLDNFNNPGDNVTFTWPVPVLSGGISGGTERFTPSSDNLTDIFLNTSGTAETAVYTVTPYYQGCKGVAKEITVTIGSQPVLDPNLSKNICSSLPTGLILGVAAGSVEATSYDVISIIKEAGLVASASNAIPANGVGSDYLSNDTLFNETGADKIITYRVRPLFGATCVGDAVDIVVTVKPQPVIMFGQTAEICSSTPVNKEILLVPGNIPSGSKFNWNLPLMSDGSVQGTSGVDVEADPAGKLHITDTLTNFGTSPITATYNIIPVSDYGCVGNAREVIVNIKPEPSTPVISGRNKICAGENHIVYTVPLTTGSTYTWTVPPTIGTKFLDANTNAVVINAASAAGTGSISVTETNSYLCTGMPGTYDIEVIEPVTPATPAGASTVCANKTETYSVPLNTGSVYTWTLPPGAVINGNPSGNSVTITFGTLGGNISVTEKNIAGCVTNHLPLAVLVNPLPSATISNSGTTCEENTHSFNVNFTGTGPWNFTYAIDRVSQPEITGVSSPYTLTANTPGNYTIVTVTDANGCNGTGSGNATLNHFPKPTAVISGSTDICVGKSAVITISLVGAMPFTFTYTDGTTPVTIQNYTSNIYTTSVNPTTTTTYTLSSLNDNNGCAGTVSGSAIITINPLPVLSFNISHLLCSGDNTGAIELTVTGATANTYSWAGPDGYSANTKDIANLKAGLYSVSVTSDNGCVSTGQVTVTQPTPIYLSTSGDINLLCNGDTSGSGSFTVSGGTSPYIFTLISNTTAGNINPQSENSISFNNAGKGSITMRVTDNNGCTDEKTITISEPEPLNIISILSKSIEGSHNISCFGGKTGTISTNVTGGIAPYNYSWSTSDGSGLVAGLASQNGLSAGTYQLTVTDANACTITESYTLSQPDSLSVVATTDDDYIGTCLSSTAQLQAIPAGGVMPASGYIYSWYPTTGLSSASIANPVAKPTSTTIYTVTITDENGCNASASVTVQVKPDLTATITASDYTIGSCPSSVASLNINVNGGEAPYSYMWNNGLTLSDSTIANPTAKPPVTTTYTVIVTDANNCQTSANVTVTVAPELEVVASVDDNMIGTCMNSKAKLSATITGGEGPFTYLWDNGTFLDDPTKPNPTAKPNSSTLFTVTVTDINGCTASSQILVNVAPDLNVVASSDDYILSTCLTSTATLNAEVTGGEELSDGGYTYSWSPSSGLNYTNVKSPVAKPSFTTTYTVTVTDRNECTAQSQVTIEVRPALAISYTTLKYNGGYDISCNGASDGKIETTTTGGEEPYVYEWTGPEGFNSTLKDISALIAGTYTVKVTDANNCQISATILLTEPAVLNLSKTSDINLSCYGDSTATGLFNATGGTAPYNFNVTNNAGADITIDASSVSFFNGSNGYVEVKVIDANGCEAVQTITISQPDDLLPGSVSGNQEVCYLGDPLILNEVTAPSGGPSTTYDYQWESANNIDGPYNPVIGATSNIYDPPAGIAATTYYRRKVTSGTCNPVYSDTITITVNPLPKAQISGSEFICPADDATLIIDINEGTSPFTIVLSDGTTVNDYISGTPVIVNPVVNTSYSISSVTDSKGCSVSAPHTNLTGSALITIKVIPEIITQPADQTVCDNQTATFSVDAGMTTNASYQWYIDRNDGLGPQLLTGETSSTLNVSADRTMNGYKYSVKVSGDCTPSITSDTAVLTVNNLPEINIQPQPVTICSGEDAVFTVDPGLTSTASIEWYVNTGSGWNLAIGARYQGTFNDTLTVVSVTESMSGYQFKAKVSGVCDPFIESDEVTLTVTRQAEIITYPVSVNICEGEAATFSVDAGLTTGPSYQWQILNGSLWEDIIGENNSSLVIPSVTSAMNGNNYRIIVSSTCGSSVNSGPVTLTVYEKPEILSQPVDTIVCAGAIVKFSIDPGVTTGPVYQWQMSADSGMSWTNVPSAGNYSGSTGPILTIYSVDSVMNGYRFKVLLSGICSPDLESDYATLTVNTSPVITLHPEDKTVCESESLNFSVTAVGTSLAFQWQVDMRDGNGFVNFSDSSGIYSGTNTNQLDVLSSDRRLDGYRYRALVSGACSPQVTTNFAVLTVKTSPEIISQPNSDTICEFNSVSFSVNAQGANLNFSWQESIAGGPYTDLTDAGNYIGTKTSSMNIFNVNRSKSQNKYRVVIGGSCNPDITSDPAELIVKTSPVIIVSPSDTIVCQNSSVKFGALAEGSDLHYQWQVSTGGSFNDIFDGVQYSGVNSSELTINNSELSMDNYRYRVSVSGTCVPPAYSQHATLYVLANPHVNYQPESSEICENDNTTFEAYVSGNDLTYKWQVNNGAGFTDISDSEYYSGSDTLRLNITNAPVSFNSNRYRLKITDKCGTYYSNEALLTVNTNPSANITGDDSFPLVCGGAELNLDGNPSGGSGPYLWHKWTGAIAPLSTTSAQQTVFKTLLHGDYELTYTVTDSKHCKGTSTVTIENNKPEADFISNAVPSCGFLEVNFTNQSKRATNYIWDFDDGSAPVNEENPIHGFDNFDPSGQVNYYNVKLTSISEKGCVDSASQIITIYPKVDPVFTIEPEEGCNPNVATLITKPGAYSYEWDFGDGQTQIAGYTVIHEFKNSDTTPKTYEVKLTTTSYYGCKASATMPVTVLPKPEAAFTVSPFIQTYPDATITVNNLVTPGPWDYLYHFGDGNSSTDPEPVHTYSDPGTYKITQIVSRGYCVDSMSQSVTINPSPPVAGFMLPETGCNPLQIQLTNTSLYATSYLWDFGDGGTSTKKDPEYVYVQSGTYVIRLMVFGPGGTATHSEIFEVNETPRVAFNYAPDTVFEDYKPVKFFNFTSGNVTTYEWDFGDIHENTGAVSSQNTSNEYEPVHVYEHPGWKDVQLIAYNENCIDTLLIEHAILVLPRREFIFPNVFRPNPVGPTGGYYDINDPNSRNSVFFPGVADDVLEYNMVIYNRWGELVFESNDINKGWDGYIKDSMAAQGVYVWKVKGKYLNGENFVFAGNVTLLH